MARISQKRTRNTFKRSNDPLEYRNIIHICTEGQETEKQYFKLLFNIARNECDIQPPTIKIVPHKHNSPCRVLRAMRQYIKDNDINKKDELWIVIDRDEWDKDEIEKIKQWEKESSNYYFAISDPKFEYWLLLHFQDGNQVNDANHCDELLKNCYKEKDKDFDYKRNGKTIPIKFYNSQMIRKAIERSEKRWIDIKTDCKCKTNVHLLVKKILMEN